MLETLKAQCPCCGEPIWLVVDTSLDVQEYIEDCEVCCRPMVVCVNVFGEDVSLDVRAERE
ncbi:MAG: CPXCG motif-containing cysteine-rich protein [Gammaproteobacteria bacterium]|nr:CPXCG motif-containing cysteine-rich protein [Gammaproteobacteria bacterium]